MLSGELRQSKEDYICAAMSLVGRVRRSQDRLPQETDDYRDPGTTGGVGA